MNICTLITWLGALMFATVNVASLAAFNPPPIERVAGSVGGIITDDHGARVVGATITFEGEQATQVVNTIEDGTYKIGLPAGLYRIKVKAKYFCSVSRPVFSVLPAEAITFNFTIIPCPIVNSFVVKNGQYKDEREQFEPPFEEETIPLRHKTSFKPLIRFGERMAEGRDLLRYKSIHLRDGRYLPTSLMINSLTVSADDIFFERKQSRFTAEGNVVVEDHHQKTYAKKATIEFNKGVPVIKLIQ